MKNRNKQSVWQMMLFFGEAPTSVRPVGGDWMGLEGHGVTGIGAVWGTARLDYVLFLSSL